mgnify:CR=1 FL=1
MPLTVFESAKGRQRQPKRPSIAAAQTVLRCTLQFLTPAQHWLSATYGCTLFQAIFTGQSLKIRNAGAYRTSDKIRK